MKHLPFWIQEFSEIINNNYLYVDEKEKYFHSLFYMVMKLVGFNIESEILTIDGKIDAVLKTDNHIYII